MGSFLITLIAGVAAGAFTARLVARREVEALRELLQERKPEAPRPAAPVPEPDIAPEITPEILMVLSAAVAAFLGKKATIRRARVAGPSLPNNMWAQAGRVFVQASHNLR